jgi:hypothetical protein
LSPDQSPACSVLGAISPAGRPDVPCTLQQSAFQVLDAIAHADIAGEPPPHAHTAAASQVVLAYTHPRRAPVAGERALQSSKTTRGRRNQETFGCKQRKSSKWPTAESKNRVTHRSSARLRPIQRGSPRRRRGAGGSATTPRRAPAAPARPSWRGWSRRPSRTALAEGGALPFLLRGGEAGSVGAGDEVVGAVEGRRVLRRPPLAEGGFLGGHIGRGVSDAESGDLAGGVVDGLTERALAGVHAVEGLHLHWSWGRGAGGFVSLFS